MQTIRLNRCETRSISIAAPPDDVLALLGDPRELPRWAPAFASEVRPDGEGWIVTGGGREFRIFVAVDVAARTVDILRDTDRRTGAFARVLPNGEGSEMLFTLFFPPDASEGEVEAQIATVEAELATVRGLVEAR